MRTLLVPIDFGDASDLVVEKAGELARELPARIFLLHVDEPRAYATVGDAATLAAWPLQTPKRISKLKARLTSLANPLRASGIKVDSVAIVGLVVDDILEQAQKYRADYIILGSHGHLSASHLFNGNVFAGILKGPTCPVIIVPVKTVRASQQWAPA
jgi:nucleotide-binding universal stress UspA family protein